MTDTDHAQRHRVVASSLGKLMRARRAALGLSQEDVAREAGLSTYAYSCMERGLTPGGRDANPTIRTLLRVFAALDIEPPELPPEELVAGHGS